jgi:hypothetical protein
MKNNMQKQRGYHRDQHQRAHHKSTGTIREFPRSKKFWVFDPPYIQNHWMYVKDELS